MTGVDRSNRDGHDQDHEERMKHENIDGHHRESIDK
jgi:hypothetical protein